jgi:hypothetical protein
MMMFVMRICRRNQRLENRTCSNVNFKYEYLSNEDEENGRSSSRHRTCLFNQAEQVSSTNRSNVVNCFVHWRYCSCCISFWFRRLTSLVIFISNFFKNNTRTNKQTSTTHSICETIQFIYLDSNGNIMDKTGWIICRLSLIIIRICWSQNKWNRFTSMYKMTSGIVHIDMNEGCCTIITWCRRRRRRRRTR